MTLSLGCGLVSRDEWVTATVCQMSGATKCRKSANFKIRKGRPR